MVTLLASSIVSDGTAPPAEIRAMWVVRTSITAPEHVARVVQLARDGGFNTLMVQVRGRGDAYYDTDLEPRAESLRKGYDPLADILAQAGKAGIAVHAWVNVMYVWSDSAKPKAANHIVNAHAGWLAADKVGQRPSEAGTTEGAYLCPSCLEGREHVRKVIRSLASRYHLAGIHLDYIRLPSAEYCYCTHCLSEFRKSLGASHADDDPKSLPERFPAEWTRWRQGLISSLVRDIHQDLKRIDHPVKLTAAVWADRHRAIDDKMQDWPHWCAEGWLDAVLPMDYDTREPEFQTWAETAKREAGKVPVWLGIGAWKLQAADTAKRIEYARKLGLPGFCLFSYGGITGDGRNDAFLKKLRPTVARD